MRLEPDAPEGEIGRAVLDCLNTFQDAGLERSSHRFYAIDGGNDLGGPFLTPEQAEHARRALPERSDWPYLPTDEPPWYGQPH